MLHVKIKDYQLILVLFVCFCRMNIRIELTRTKTLNLKLEPESELHVPCGKTVLVRSVLRLLPVSVHVWRNELLKII